MFNIIKIANLPDTIKNWVIENQLDQNNEPNLTLDLDSELEDGNFNWELSIEEYYFWYYLAVDSEIILLNSETL